jgi:hypothetical protein
MGLSAQRSNIRVEKADDGVRIVSATGIRSAAWNKRADHASNRKADFR